MKISQAKYDAIIKKQLIWTNPYYSCKSATVKDKNGFYHACQVWFNKNKDVVEIIPTNLKDKDENTVKNTVRRLGGTIFSFEKANLL